MIAHMEKTTKASGLMQNLGEHALRRLLTSGIFILGKGR